MANTSALYVRIDTEVKEKENRLRHVHYDTCRRF